MGFFENIKNNFGEDAYRNFKEWANTSRQLANFENHKKSLLQCKRQDVTPAYLNNSTNLLQFLLVEENPFQEKYFNTIK